MIDLFEDYENLPIEVLTILDKIDSEFCSYEDCKNIVTQLNKIGYSCKYGLSGELFNLKKI